MQEQSTFILPARFDYGYHKEFQQQCELFIDSKKINEMILDFGQVEYIDSAALGMMLMWRKRAGTVNKAMKIKAARGGAAEILKMANMQKIFEFI